MGRSLITNATNAGSGYNVASVADNLREDPPPVPNAPNYLASELMLEHSVASPVIGPSSLVVAPSSSVVAPSTPAIPPPGSSIAPSGRNELVSRPMLPATVGQIVTSQLVRDPALLAAAQTVPVLGGMGSACLLYTSPTPRDS